MTNQFIQDARFLIGLHGSSVQFITTTTGAYDIEQGMVVNTESTVTVKAFPKKIIATQYNAPSLVGQTLTEFLVVAADLPSKPKFQDKVVYASDTYTVQTVKQHDGFGEPVIYKVLCSQG